MTRQPDLFRCAPFFFDGDPAATASEPVPTETPSTTSEPTHTMAARAAAIFRSRPGQWIDGRVFADACGYAGWRTRISDCRRAPWFMDIENRQRKDGRYTISEYRWNAPAGDRS